MLCRVYQQVQHDLLLQLPVPRRCLDVLLHPSSHPPAYPRARQQAYSTLPGLLPAYLIALVSASTSTTSMLPARRMPAKRLRFSIRPQLPSWSSHLTFPDHRRGHAGHVRPAAQVTVSRRPCERLGSLPGRYLTSCEAASRIWSTDRPDGVRARG
eukprot:763757-Hanusia_phi.AAC.1